MLLRRFARVALALAVLLSVSRAEAIYHLVVIDEVLTSYNGDPGIQFVELTRLDNLFVDATVFVELGDGHQLAVTNGGTAGFARFTASGP